MLITLISCGTNKQNVQTEKINISKSLEYKLSTELLIGKITEIDSTKSVYKITVWNNQKHTILSKKTKEKWLNSELLKTGLEYEFKVIPLTHVNIRNETYSKEINGISVMPSFRIQDCIKYGGVEFCSDEGEVYEGVNINGLYVK